MTLKSVIDVTVNDQEFQKFYETFSKFREQVKDLPPIWGGADGSVKDLQTSIDKLTESIQNQVDLFTKVGKAHEDILRGVEKTNREMANLGRTTEKLYGFIKGITIALLSWKSITGVFNFMSGTSGFFGFNNLAQGAANTRQQANLLGVAPNELQAYQNATQRYSISNSLLEHMNVARGDVRQQGMLRATLGFTDEDFANKSAAELSIEAMKRMREKLRKMSPQQRIIMAEAYGWSDMAGGWGPLQEMLQKTPGEMAGVGKAYRENLDKFKNAPNGPVADDFMQRINRVWTELENGFWNKLQALSDPLSKLADAFKNLVLSGLDSPAFKDGIKYFAEVVNKWAVDLQKPEIRSALADFLTNLELVVQGLGRAVSYLASWFPGFNKNNPQPGPKNPGDFVPGGAGGPRVYDPFGHAFRGQSGEWQTLPPGTGGGATGTWGAEPQSYTPGSLPPGLLQQIAYTPTGGYFNGPGMFALGVSAMFRPANGNGLYGQIENDFGLPSGLLSIIQHIETGNNPNQTSKAGAQGPFQFMPGTARRYGLKNPFDQGAAAFAAGNYLSDLTKMFGGDVLKAAAGYNWGEGNVQKAIARSQRTGLDWRTFLPPETAAYVNKVQSQLGNPQTGGGSLYAQPGQGVRITVYNATGGNAVNVAAALAA